MEEDSGKQAERRRAGPSIRELDAIQKALEERPHVSIRFRIAAVFTILFFLMCSVTVSAVYLLNRLGQKQIFFEKISTFVFEIQQARRFEKNYFLYGTNLQDAITNVHVARGILVRNKQDVALVLGVKDLDELLKDLEEYQKILEGLLERSPSDRDRNKIEMSLRKYGAQLLLESQEALKREKQMIHSMLQVSTVAAIGFLAFMVVLLLVFGVFITQTVLRPLGRFMRYADRIANGDMSPITPARKYRDEFSMLAIAFNRMLKDLLKRHQQLIQSEKMAVVGNLTSGIAHELNNPLNNISLSVEALLDGLDDYPKDQIRHILEQVATQVDRASGTVRNLLDFTRKEQQVFTSLDINSSLEAALKLVENERKLAGISLETEFSDNVPKIKGNPRGVEQVFLNLFLNAIQAMGDHGTLKVKTHAQDGSVKVEVSDTGPGISKEHIQRIFEPFFTTKQPGKGTGLGLSVSQSIVDEHGGTIQVSSEPGKGTTFVVQFPAADEKNEPE